MTHTLTRRRVVAALAGLPLVGLSLARWGAAGTAEPARAAPALMGKPTPTPTPIPGDFTLSTNLGPDYEFRGELVRGGSWGPQYKAFFYGCSYTTDTIWMVSLNDFSGTITLEILNLPAGVTSQTETSIFLPAGSARGTSFKLVAASNAATGNATVTIRATSGAIVHTIEREIWVVDELSPCE